MKGIGSVTRPKVAISNLNNCIFNASLNFKQLLHVANDPRIQPISGIVIAKWFFFFL